MHTVKKKVSDAASVAKEHAQIYKAQVEEKAEKAAARTREEKEIAHERRKAKEVEAKMVMHQEKAEHVAEKLHGKQHHHLTHQPVVGGVDPMTGTAAPHYPLGGPHHLTHHPVAGTVDPAYPTGGPHHLPHQTVGVVDPSYPTGGQLAGHHNKYV